MLAPISLEFFTMLPRSFPAFFLCLLLTPLAAPRLASSQDISFDREALFTEVSSLIQKNFYDPKLRGLDWPAIENQYRPMAHSAADRDAFAKIINQLLANLKTSHTAYFSKNDPKRYQILGVFESLAEPDESDRWEYDGIGVDVESRDGKTFLRSVYDGLPAHKAGLLYGDEILSVDGTPFHPILSFAGKSAKEVLIKYRRQEDAPPREVVVNVERLDGRTLFLRALEASVSIHERHGRKIGYLHAWSYAGAKYQERIRHHLIGGNLKDCDAVILDLRDGWGGASFEYLDLFRPSILEMKSTARNGDVYQSKGAWNKPVALLVNARTTSGKEVFTYGFKKLGLGKVIGEPTAGAVVAGSPKLLSNGDVLYLAVADVQIDGKRLEGAGVAPDIAIPRPLPYAGGADPQREKALDILSGK